MSTGALLGVVGTLALVLGLMAVALRLLRRFAAAGSVKRGRLPLEVVQRVALGPKQGIAVVRIGERLLAVSLGDGGVRPLAELGDAERALLATPARPDAVTAASRTALGRFAGLAGLVTPAAAAATAATPTPVASGTVVTPLRATVPVRRAALLSPLPATRAVPDPAAAPEPAAAIASAPTPTPSDFRDVLRAALGGGLAAVVPFVLAAALAVAPAAAHAQAAAPATAPATTTAAPDEMTAQAAQGVQETLRQGAATLQALQAAFQPVAPAATSGALQPPVAISGPAPRRTPPAPPAAQPQPLAQASPGVEPPALARVGVDSMIGSLAPQMDLRVGDAQGGLRLSGTVGIVVMMGLLTLLPTLLLMMTGFTRILIVLHFLRQAMGTQSAPPGHLVAGLALLLTGFVMAPTLAEVNERALQPWLNGEIEQVEMLKTGAQPFRDFMLRQTRESDIRAFIDMSEAPEPATVDDVSLVVLTSAFVVSELRTAFQIGFALFLPFIVIDVVVSSVLMSMGMFMLPPAMISLPFKLLLFVLVDGWALLVQSLVQSFK